MSGPEKHGGDTEGGTAGQGHGWFANPYVLLPVATACWGANAVVGKYAATLMSPITLTFLRWVVGSLVVVALALPWLRADLPQLRRHWRRVFAYGAFGFAGFNLCLYAALHHTSAINVSIEQAGMPVLIIVANFLLFGQHARPVQLLGVLLTVLGVLVTATHGDLGLLLQAELNRGDAIMLLGVLLYGGYALGLRFKPPMHWMSLLAGMAVAALFTSAPVMAWQCASSGCELPGWRGWLVIGFVALLPTLTAQLFFMRGVELLGPNRAGLFINLVPIFGAAFAVGFLGEPLRPFHMAGLSLVLGGIWLAERFSTR